MDDKKITAEDLLAALDLDLTVMAQKAAEAINNATPEAIVAESEKPARDANAKFRQRLYQKTIAPPVHFIPKSARMGKLILSRTQ